MTLTPEQFEAGFELFSELVTSDLSGYGPELDVARERFFGSAQAEARAATNERSTERRMLEWFLFEDARTPGAELVVNELLEPWAERVSRELREEHAAYLQSQTGIFEVRKSDDGSLISLRELAGLGRFELAENELGAVFENGDLIVGRLYPLGDGSFHVSPGAGVFRDPRLLKAIERDLEQLRASRPHAVMRLSQLELELMFWRTKSELSEDVAASADPVGELETFLTESGVEPEQSKTWLAALRRAPYNPDSLVPGAGDVLAEILEQLAFETTADLERARVLFVAAWPLLNAAAVAGKPAQDEPTSAVELAMAEFDRDRAAGIDVETSFAELERKLGLDALEDDDPHEAPDFPGVVGAMVEEYLWEARSAAHEGLRLFAGYTRNIGVFENLAARDFLTFAAFWLPESRQLKNGAEAERLMRALAAFGQWAVESHGVEVLDDDLEERLDGLRKSLPRSVVANALLPRVRDVEGELFTFAGTTDAGLGLIRDAEGLERSVELDGRLRASLEEGDLFRGYTRDDGEFVVACCYPPEALDLRQAKR